MKMPKGYKALKVDYDDGEKPGWIFEAPDGRQSDDSWTLRRYAIAAAHEHKADLTKPVAARRHLTVAQGGLDLQ